MAYSKIKNKFSSKDIKYISKDFGSFKNKLDLQEHRSVF